ncbi:hypothetical protein [Mucilaginibacter celer]|uniref:Histidine kinase N-terminal 7TM region domain-containing protein n=1 Tax=Mucilaginibacter celer TaxID=2305508 RepID=A0A494VN03_9SPHI|nr:hypothetical protein [Mucilaginibacter celer]AYL96737.1 hypothetical protein HYN43_016145 [Mucilaginibacter celer]
MVELIKSIADWSEVWALLIPLAILFFKKKQPVFSKPVVAYIWVALIINTIIDTVWKLKLVLPPPYNTNNYLYNLHSVIRLLLFSSFFIRLNQPFLSRTKRVVPFVFLALVLINFSFYQNFFDYGHLSSRLLSFEAVIMMFYCMQYYLFKITEDEEPGKKQPDFWIVTGIGIYYTVNFFIFLLYNQLTLRLHNFAISLWNIHNFTYTILCIFIAKGLYESNER